MIDYNKLKVGDQYVENEETLEVTYVDNSSGQLVISVKPVQVSE